MKHILGFRTNKLWKKIIAIVYYLFLLLFGIILLTTGTPDKILLYGTKNDITVNKIYNIITYLLFLFPIVILEMRHFLKLNIPKTILTGIIMLIGWFIVLMCIPSYSEEYNEYLDKQKQELAQQQYNKEKNSEKTNKDLTKNKNTEINENIDDSLEKETETEVKNEEKPIEIKKTNDTNIAIDTTKSEKYTTAKLIGHGSSDDGREEPNYIGIKGYAVVYGEEEYNISENDKFDTIAWEIPIYEKDKQFYEKIGTIPHKTEIGVVDQELEHEGYGNYDGYLKVEIIESGEIVYIDVSNFATEAYWNLNIENAAKSGICVAEYNQVSDYWPVTGDNKKVELDENTHVLIEGYDSYKKDTPIQAIVFKNWTYGYGGVDVYFNKDDLKIIY